MRQLLSVAVALATLCSCRAGGSPLKCAELPVRDTACSSPPVVVLHPSGSPDGDAQGRYFWYDVSDNSTVCACPRTQIAKCCPRGYVLEDNACAKSSLEFRPVITVAGDNISLTDYDEVAMTKCVNIVPVNSSDYVGVTADGQLHTRMLGAYVVEPRRFCLENSLDGGAHQVALVCWDGREPGLKPKFIIFSSIMLASTPFILVTALVHVVLPRLRNLHGYIVCCYSLSLLLAYVSLGSTQIASRFMNDTECVTLAFIIYFSFLASFFWLNVMCFDIFWTFSGFRSLRGTAREREHKKFIIYSIYSWGCPLILLSVTLVMQFHNDIPDGLLRPQFGVKRCWFPDDITILAYFYGPVGVLVLCNIILFILTAIRIAQLKRETAMLKGTDSRRHDDDNRQRFNLYLKLFLVMGVNWSMEVISGLVGGPEYVWYVTDICNTLQGVLIFVIFVWKDRIRRMLMEKFCPKRASTKLSKSTVVTYSTRASPSRLSHGVLNNKVTDNSNGDVVKITAITPISDDSDVP
ncbi:G-protein coupled receptor Mth2-like isoform X4 [Schistocerca cancellata]|uniref:G-protein coupled receptor Mth2-like isoform X4 n=1 Tax=Schistocerca cancellata TaxID=274614 RepID=UPI002119B3E1|nr:G-protein coupled receptor Mth2-like isoform X4 [Schistocerca cancellata]